MTFPRSSHITLRGLFGRGHLPLLAASVLPAVFLSVSTRVGSRLRRLRKVTQHALYIPSFCIAVAIVFWIVVAISGTTDTKRLASAGWLFAVDARREPPVTTQTWNYWALFNFSLIEWRALAPVLSHIFLLVVVGALSLPVLAPLVAEEAAQQLLREKREASATLSFDVGLEFLGHALSNIASAIAGALPNMVVRQRYSTCSDRLALLTTRRSSQTLGSSHVPPVTALMH